MLTAHNIHKSYGKVQVLKGIDITLQEGEVVALVGSSGAGKSTLLQVLGTLDSADAGTIVFQGKNILQYNARQQADFRNQSLGFVFQFHHLLPEFTALENVSMPALIAGISPSVAQGNALKLMETLGIAHRKDHKPGELSGGEQQRVSVARALMNNPRLVLADEPTGNLDTANSEALYKLFFELSREMGISFLIATHNMELANNADKLLKIKDGVMVDDM